MHRAREFGVMVPAIDVLEERQLSKSEIKSVAEILLAPSGDGLATLPDPAGDWETFVQAVSTAQQEVPLVFCPVKKQLRPWLNVFELRQYQPDPVRIVLERNEELLWRIYLFYSYNAVVMKEILTGGMKGGSAAVQAKLKPMPVFKSTFRYEKRLLHQDDLWQLLNDFALVPAVVNTIRFNKLISELVLLPSLLFIYIVTISLMSPYTLCQTQTPCYSHSFILFIRRFIPYTHHPFL